jgi:hypothetical protein
MIVEIGPHRLFSGDAYAIRPTLGWFDADVLDPPYEFKASGGGHYRSRRPNMDELIDQQLHVGFDMAIINPMLCGAAVVFVHNDQLAELLTHAKGSFNRHALCVWAKTNPQPVANKHYRPQLEYYVHAWSRGYHPDGTMADLMRLTVASGPRGQFRFNHPTCKPPEIMNKIMTNVRGATVCDPFMGTGSTGVAAIKAGKVFTGIEHNLQHFETACGRIRAAFAQVSG